MSEFLLSLRHLNAWYGHAQALFNVSFSVKSGEIIALMGHNGAGKSTLLKALVHLLTQNSEQFIFDGKDVRKLSPDALCRLGIGWVPEDRRIFTNLTVLENLKVGRPLKNNGLPLMWSIERVLTLFPPLAPLLKRKAAQLSGGEQQMLTVARTLLLNPKILLLDEPSEGVAPLVVERMKAAVVEMKAAGLSLILAEQNTYFVQGLAERAIVLLAGKVAFDGPLPQAMSYLRVGMPSPTPDDSGLSK